MGASSSSEPQHTEESKFSGISIDQTELKEAKQIFETGDKSAVRDFIQRKTEAWATVPLKIGVIGNSGSGKSSFVNTIRGLSACDEGAAPVGVKETTGEPTVYPHPRNPMLEFWDLPGVGTPKFPREQYLEKMGGIAMYDFFILITADRFTENDKWLAVEIEKGRKGFFFVRTKVGIDVRNDRYDNPKGHSAENVLNTLKADIMENLGEVYAEEKVFLIDSHQRGKYDFEKLESQLISDFPDMKKEALVMSLSVLSKAVLEEKVKVLKGWIYAYAAASGALGAVPVPGVSFLGDLGILLGAATHFFHQLGLDEKSMECLAAQARIPENRDPQNARKSDEKGG